MVISSLLEAGMLVCWGASWPFQVIKTYSSKDISGKSILFLWLIETGYILGLIYKIFYHYDYVIFLYILNFIFVAIDIILYYCYKLPESVILHKMPAKMVYNDSHNSEAETLLRR